jgi:P27 family predicted phage terminase small subunit
MAGNANSGRPKKPALIRRLEGKRGHRPIPADEPDGLGDPAYAPYFTAEHKALFDATLAALPDGLVTAADQAILELFVTAWATFRSATALIARTGPLVTSPNGPVLNPLMRVRSRAASEMASAAAVLGLSPQARTRLIAAKAEDDDPMAVLLGMDGPDGAWTGRRH